MILSDNDIRDNIDIENLVVRGMTKDTIRENGLDLRIDSTYSIEDFRYEGQYVDLHNQNPRRFVLKQANKEGSIIIQPGQFMLLSTKEFIELPKDIMAFCCIRSTIARTGILAPPTIVDCGFKGTLTIEIFNASKSQIIMHEDDRFLHVVLAYTRTPSVEGYQGLYQGQKIVTVPKESVQ